MIEDRDKWRKYVHDVANPRIEDGERKNRTEQIALGDGVTRLLSIQQSSRW